MSVAIIPAAGKSSRMGRPKLSLPLGDKTVLEHVIAAFLRGGCSHVLVILAPHVAELGRAAVEAGARVVSIPRETPDMRATVEYGWGWWEHYAGFTAEDYWYLAPADHPVLDGGIVALLEAERLRHPDRTILVPAYQGKRGHPALIAWKHVAGMRALPPGVGLNTYLREHPEETLEVPVESPGVLLDLDTPEDYERLRG
jgi:molybdenum cofactor cytidylyltransferase